MRQPPVSAARALGQLFALPSASASVSPIAVSASAPRLPTLLLRNTATGVTTTTTATIIAATRQPLRNAGAVSRELGPARTFATTAYLQKRERSRSMPKIVQKTRPRNEEIPYRWVRLPQQDGSLSEPMRLERVLRSIDLDVDFLEMVARPKAELMREKAQAEAQAAGEGEGEGKGEAEGKGEGEGWFGEAPGSFALDQTDEAAEAAICRIMNIEAARKAAEEAEREARRRATSTKELEFNWAIARHDVKHKLRRMRQFLEKGLFVEVLLAKKRNSRLATREEATWLYNAVREVADSVRGTVEYRRAEGEVNGVMKLYFQGPSEKRRAQFAAEQAENPEGAADGEVDGVVDVEAEGHQQGQGQEQGQADRAN